jgi:molybdopterin-dependent oxidoreductase alpha subunit
MNEEDMPEHPYPGTPGGWGSLKASARKVHHEGSLTQAAAALLRVNQKKGFDCPGCAWPESNDHRSPFEFCEQGVKAVASETTARRVTRDFFSKHSVSALNQQSDSWLEDQGRLTEPMAYNPETDHYEPISWEAAFQRLGESLKALDHPDEAVFYTSGRTSNEAAYLYQLFGRMFGTNNFPDCSNMCHESSGIAMIESIGIGKGTVTLEDFSKADLIIVAGQNPASNHPRMMSQLQEAHRRGAKVVSINPLRERGLERFIHPQEPGSMLTGTATSISDVYLQPVIGGDMAVFTGISKAVLDLENQTPGQVLDHAFIEEHSSGFDDFVTSISTTSWDEIEKQSGLLRSVFDEMGALYAESKQVIICWAMGLTQNKHAVAAIQQVINLLLLRGNIGRPGAGACPVRGHSNVQGDRTVGITEKPSAAFLKALEARFSFTPPLEHGMDVVAAIKAMDEERVKVFFAMGGNFIRATPDPVFTEQAMRKCALTAHVTTKLNRSHLIHGAQALILPCLGRTEADQQATGPQRVSVENSMGVVHSSKGQIKPASEQLRSEPAIVAGLAKETLGSHVDWDELAGDYRLIRDHIEATIPGFDHYNEHVESERPLVLYNSARAREWITATGKARFMAYALPDMSLPDGQFRFATIRSHDQYNTTIYSAEDRYRGIKNNRRVVFMHPVDMEVQGFHSGTVVNLRSHCEDGIARCIEGFEVLPYPIARGCAAGYYPETNGLVSIDSYADRSRTPLSKFIPVTIEKTE